MNLSNPPTRDNRFLGEYLAAKMATKRELEQLDGGETPEHEPKRSKKQHGKKRQHQNSGIDATWGQKYVFSNVVNATTIPAGEESDFEDDTDAMAYLNSVR